jgi:hypothetical protein
MRSISQLRLNVLRYVLPHKILPGELNVLENATILENALETRRFHPVFAGSAWTVLP